MRTFSTDHACENGLGRYEVRKLLAEDVIVRVSRGAYVTAADAGTLPGRAGALCRVLPPWAIVCRRTAAWLWGLDVLPPGTSQAQWPGDVVDLGDLRVTSPERTALDCARFSPRLEAVAALDQFLRRGVSRGALRERTTALGGHRNVARLRAALEVADAGAESPGESWTRVLVVDAGLPHPATQVPVRLPDGGLAYLDMAVEAYRTALEYDGEEHHTGAADERHDARRRRGLERAGWPTIVVRREHVLGDPHAFLDTLAETLLSRGWSPSRLQLDDVQRRIAALGVHRRDGGAGP